MNGGYSFVTSDRSSTFFYFVYFQINTFASTSNFPAENRIPLYRETSNFYLLSELLCFQSLFSAFRALVGRIYHSVIVYFVCIALVLFYKWLRIEVTLKTKHFLLEFVKGWSLRHCQISWRQKCSCAFV